VPRRTGDGQRRWWRAFAAGVYIATDPGGLELVRRVLFQRGGIRVYSYPALLYLGLILGIAAGNLAAHAAGLDAARVFVATLILLVPALVGARLLFVASHWRGYRREPARIWRRAEGGAAMYGGIPCMLLASVPLLGALDVPFGAFWDVATFSILVGMGFTRIGCLLNGCCAGRPSGGRFALVLPDHQGIRCRRIPTQLLEAGWAALLLLGALAIWPALPFPGALFLAAIVAYAVGRVGLEATRETRDVLGPFDLHQVLSATLVVSGLGCLVLLGR
jgi:phosphatidylglycerol---prolipoprotein diacylglyceryl transferase